MEEDEIEGDKLHRLQEGGGDEKGGTQEERREGDADKEIVTMSQVDREEWCKTTANANNKVDTQAACPAETSQAPLVLSTHQLHLYQGLNSTDVELSLLKKSRW